MYSDDVRLQPCTGGGAVTKMDCEACLFTEVCLTDTLHYEDLTGESRQGMFGGLTIAERNRLRREL